MRIKSIAIFLLIINNTILAQGQSNKYEVLYHFIYQIDSTNAYSINDEEMILFTDGKKSLFESYVQYQMDSLMQRDLDNGYRENDIVMKLLSGSYPKPKVHNKLKKDFSMKKYIRERKIGNELYRYKEDFDLKWKIHNDSVKDYHGMKTILATTRMGGRDYKVWFCPEIPIPDGPYKFQGLPGLVVHAKDTNGYFEFALDAIRKVPEFHYDDYNPFETKVIDATKEEYEKAIDYYQKNKYKLLKQRGITILDENKKEFTDKNRKEKHTLQIEIE